MVIELIVRMSPVSISDAPANTLILTVLSSLVVAVIIDAVGMSFVPVTVIVAVEMLLFTPFESVAL